MFRKTLSFALIFFVVNLALATTVNAASNADKEARFAEKVKVNILKIGTGTDARIEVKLKDNSKIKGYVREANEESFVVVNEKTARAKPFPIRRSSKLKAIIFRRALKLLSLLLLVSG